MAGASDLIHTYTAIYHNMSGHTPRKQVITHRFHAWLLSLVPIERKKVTQALANSARDVAAGSILARANTKCTHTSVGLFNQFQSSRYCHSFRTNSHRLQDQNLEASPRYPGCDHVDIEGQISTHPKGLTLEIASQTEESPSHRWSQASAQSIQ